MFCHPSLFYSAVKLIHSTSPSHHRLFPTNQTCLVDFYYYFHILLNGSCSIYVILAFYFDIMCSTVQSLKADTSFQIHIKSLHISKASKVSVVWMYLNVAAVRHPGVLCAC